MNDLSTRLMNAARAQAPSDSVPGGFEKQVMARIQALKLKRQIGPLRIPEDIWTVWTRTFQRAACSGAAVALLLTLGSAALLPLETEDSDISLIPSDTATGFTEGLGGENW